MFYDKSFSMCAAESYCSDELERNSFRREFTSVKDSAMKLIYVYVDFCRESERNISFFLKSKGIFIKNHITVLLNVKSREMSQSQGRWVIKQNFHNVTRARQI